MKKDDNYIAGLEKAISEKYGAETVQNPKGNWDSAKEEEYIEQLKKISDKLEASKVLVEKVDIGGFLVSKKLLNREQNKSCASCGKYFFKRSDDIYMNKYGCCHQCYITNIEDKQSIEEIKNAKK
tara:strand:- start:340 stop:714 length:375 start_codon:yes stop_codon:yes gene_type:complete